MTPYSWQAPWQAHTGHPSSVLSVQATRSSAAWQLLASWQAASQAHQERQALVLDDALLQAGRQSHIPQAPTSQQAQLKAGVCAHPGVLGQAGKEARQVPPVRLVVALPATGSEVSSAAGTGCRFREHATSSGLDHSRTGLPEVSAAACWVSAGLVQLTGAAPAR